MIKVIISGQSIRSFTALPIVADSVDYITAAFIFQTSDWDGLKKYAHFSNGSDNYDIELIDDVISANKHLNFTTGEWTLWVHGSVTENGELKQRITTDEVTFYVKPTGATETGNPFPSAVPSITEQIIAKIGELEQLATTNKETLVNAINEVFRTVGSEISPELIAAAVEEYLEKNPIGDDFLTEERLQEAIDTALAQAKESGEFDGEPGEQGPQGEQGPVGNPGIDGTTPHIGDNGNWFIGATDTGVAAGGSGGGTGNLLHNSDWAYSLVNQRGHSGAVSNDYCIDRWIGNGSVTPSAGNHVALTAGTTMVQYMEILPAALIGRGCCVSVEVGSDIWSAPIAFPIATGAAANTVSLTCCNIELGFLAYQTMICGVPSDYVPYIKLTATADVNIKRVFLEFGDKCHMSETPPKDRLDNLAKCKRFFYRNNELSDRLVFGYYTSSATVFAFPFPTVNMRIRPNVSIDGYGIFRGINGYPTSNGTSGDSLNEFTHSAAAYGVLIKAPFTFDVTNNTPGTLSFSNDSYVSLDAEIKP